MVSLMFIVQIRYISGVFGEPETTVNGKQAVI